MVVPAGKFMTGEVVFQGPCTAPVTVEIQGTVLTKTDLSAFSNKVWITVTNVDDVIFTGGGTLNGQGEANWKNNDCKGKGDCENTLPDSIQFSKVTNGVMKDLNLVNSKGFHVKICCGSSNFTVQNLTITAPGDSPNTDGI